ncbi:MAG: hypothetical protein JWM80_197 [Cyanobacteria bacterium RYN_339]|nr:hypothetical protein [Cyanobacteria bacterium RYN_339]
MVPVPAEAPVAVAASGFSGMRATGHFFKGLWAQGADTVKGVIAHPLRALAFSAAVGGAIALAPVVGIASAATAGLVVSLGFAAWGAWGIFKGYSAYKAHRAAGDGAAAELDFETIGRGAFDVTLSLAPLAAEYAFKRWGPRSARPVATRRAAPPETVAPRRPLAPRQSIRPPAAPHESPTWLATRADRLRELAFQDFRAGKQDQGVVYHQAAIVLDELAKLMRRVAGQAKRGTLTAGEAAEKVATLRAANADALQVAHQVRLTR